MAILKVERRGKVVVLTLDRPERRNAISGAADGAEFARVCAELNRDDGIRCMVLTGAGSSFSAGGDIKAMRDRAGPHGYPPLRHLDHYRRNVHEIVRALHGLEIPSIAAVNGPAIGLGCDIACITDIRIAADSAKFGVTFLNLGVIPGDGGAWLLPRIIGMSRASELLFTGDIIDAKTAEAWGLVSHVVPSAELIDHALALADRVAKQPPHALRLAKVLLRHGQLTGLDTLLEMSAMAQAISHVTEDHLEGVEALIEKRVPKFAL
jgi:enoyl-CoA hydratase/carnithine racemase